MKQTILILALCLSTLFSSATIIKGTYLRTIKKPGQTAIVICTKSKSDCFQVVVRYFDNVDTGSWTITAFGNGDPTHIVDEFVSLREIIQNPEGTDGEDYDSYQFQLP